MSPRSSFRNTYCQKMLEFLGKINISSFNLCIREENTHAKFDIDSTLYFICNSYILWSLG